MVASLPLEVAFLPPAGDSSLPAVASLLTLMASLLPLMTSLLPQGPILILWLCILPPPFSDDVFESLWVLSWPNCHLLCLGGGHAVIMQAVQTRQTCTLGHLPSQILNSTSHDCVSNLPKCVWAFTGPFLAQ